MDLHWNDLFRRKLSREHRTWVKELIATRNKWAHAGLVDMADEDAWRRPSGSRFPHDIESIRSRAGHHRAGELDSFVRVRANGSFLRFAHEGFDGVGRAVTPGAIAIAPAGCAGLIAVVRCGQHAKELRLRSGFGELRRQRPPMIGTGRLLPIPASLPRPSVRRTLRSLFRYQPLRIEAGQRVAFQAFPPDQIRRCSTPAVLGDSGATEFSCQIPATEELLQGAGRRHRRATMIAPLPVRAVIGWGFVAISLIFACR